jgi:hypothetical protein
MSTFVSEVYTGDNTADIDNIHANKRKKIDEKRKGERWREEKERKKEREREPNSPTAYCLYSNKKTCIENIKGWTGLNVSTSLCTSERREW